MPTQTGKLNRRNSKRERLRCIEAAYGLCVQLERVEANRPSTRVAPADAVRMLRPSRALPLDLTASAPGATPAAVAAGNRSVRDALWDEDRNVALPRTDTFDV